MAIDKIDEHYNVRINKIKFKALIAEADTDVGKVLLMKPTTFMNNSGEALREAMNFYKLKPEQVVVIFDDISLDVGKMRIRSKGSDGGQKGMRSIIYLSGSDMFPRIKIGIGAKPNPNWELANWVLSKFTDSEMKEIEKMADNANTAIEHIIDGNISKAMNLYN